MRKVVALLAAIGVLAPIASAANSRPPLPNLAKYFGQNPKAVMRTGNGYRFACFEFLAKNGVLEECYVIGRTGSIPVAPKKSKPSGPAA